MLQRWFKLCLALLALALLSACSHPVKLPLVPVALPSLAGPPPPSRDDAIKQLQATVPCCTSWGDLPLRQMLPKEPHDFVVEPSSPVAKLNGEPTHYLTFVLPEYRSSYRVAFRARPSARRLQSSYLFAPTATLLDAQFQPLHSEDIKLCEYIGWRPSISGAFGSLMVDDAQAKYLVITSSAAQLKSSTYWEQSPTGFTSTVSTPPSSKGSFKIPHGPDGDLTVGKLTHSYRRAIENAICGKPEKGSGLLPQLRKSVDRMLP